MTDNHDRLDRGPAAPSAAHLDRSAGTKPRERGVQSAISFPDENFPEHFPGRKTGKPDRRDRTSRRRPGFRKTAGSYRSIRGPVHPYPVLSS